MTLNVYKNKIKALLKNENDYLSEEDISLCLESGLIKLSKDKPKITEKVIEGNNNNIYPLPNDWEKGFSFIQALEYPADLLGDFLDEDEYQIFEDAEGPKILFTKYNVTLDSRFRIYYAVPFIVREEINNVPNALCYPLIYISASLACIMLSEKYSQFNDLHSGLVKNTDLAEFYRKTALDFRNLYEDIIFNKAPDGGERHLIKGLSCIQKAQLSKKTDNTIFH